MNGIMSAHISLVNARIHLPPQYAAPMSEIGARVRALRHDRKLTQVQLAKLCGVDQSTISNIERGATAEMLGPTLSAICQHLRTNPNWLLHGKGEPGPTLIAGNAESELLAIFAELDDALQDALLRVARSMRSNPG